MPATYTTRNRAIKQETGSNLNIWGESLNNQALDLFDESLDGISTINLGGAATFDLSSATYTKNGESDTSRRRILIFINPNAAGTAVTVPGVEKWYFVRNSGSYPVTLAPSGGTPASVPAGADAIIYSDGTDCFVFRQRLNEMAAPDDDVDLNSQKLINVADGTNDTDGVNKLQVTSLTSANVQLAEDWATKDTDYVSGTDNSAKSWAIGGTGNGDPAAGSAKEWATSTSVVSGGLKGARGYASDASGSASSASGFSSDASGYATAALGYSNNASGFATAASGSATNAANTYTDFLAKWFVGSAEPVSPQIGYVWFDTSGNVLKVRDATNTVWQTVTGLNSASETVAGIIEIATQTETNTGTDDARAVTPLKFKTKLDAETGPLDTRISALEAGFVAGSPVTASGASVVFTSLDCDDIVFKIDGVSHNSGTNSSLRLYYSTDNGSSWSSSLAVLSATFAASLFLSSTVAIIGLREGTGMIVAGQGSTSITFPNIITLGISPTHAISAGAQINAIKFEWNTGASFDAGTITASTRG